MPFSSDYRESRPDFFKDYPFREWFEEEEVPDVSFLGLKQPTNQSFFFERGRLWLSERSPSSDRGRCMTNLDLFGGLPSIVMNSWPRYFFDDARAKQELATWLAAVEADETWQPPEGGFVLGDVVWSHRTDACNASIHPIANNVLPLVANYAFFVTSFDELKVFIDEMDLFPRPYFDLEIAIAEAQDWLTHRGQWKLA